MKHILALLLVLLTTSFKAAAQEPEISLFDSDGSPVAYINMEDEMTIYSWSGKPVAYLESSSGGGFNIYEFNGKHLGWFESGFMRDHDGKSACGTRNVVKPKLEPLKKLKQLKPLKALTRLEPLRPIDKLSWSDTSCAMFLYEGAK